MKKLTFLHLYNIPLIVGYSLLTLSPINQIGQLKTIHEGIFNKTYFNDFIEELLASQCLLCIWFPIINSYQGLWIFYINYDGLNFDRIVQKNYIAIKNLHILSDNMFSVTISIKFKTSHVT